MLAQAAGPALKADQVVAFVLLNLFVILVAARLVGTLFERLKQPRVVGEISAGVLLGPTFLGPAVFTWSDPPKFLHCADALGASGAVPSITTCLFPPQARSALGILGQLALTLFMFIVGLELNLGRTNGRRRGIATVAVGVVAVPMALGFVIAPMLYDSRFVGMFGTPAQPSRLAFALMVGAMLSVTAVPVMARILQEKGLTQTTMGSVGVASAALTSVLMFLAVATATAASRNASGGEIATKYLLSAVYLAVIFVPVRRLLKRMARRYELAGVLTPTMFAGVLTLVFASSYVADRLGLTVIVGAFVVGVIVEPRRAMFREFHSRLQDVTAIVLLPVFLAFSGLNTDFTKLGASFVPGLTVFLLAGIVGKWAGGAVSARLGGLSWAEGNVIGVLMNCRGLLVLVVALIAFNAGVISGQLQVAAVLMALITTMMTGPLFDRFMRKIPGDAPDEGEREAPRGQARPRLPETRIPG
ncbi:MAG: cation:proton antiporter [Actinomycetota bacterium]